MIRDGVTLIRGADDLLDDLGIDRAAPPPAPPDLTDDERRVWDALSGGSLPDAVAREARMSIPDAVTTLIQLELRGLIEASAAATNGGTGRPLGSPAEEPSRIPPPLSATWGVRASVGG